MYCICILSGETTGERVKFKANIWRVTLCGTQYEVLIEAAKRERTEIGVKFLSGMIIGKQSICHVDEFGGGEEMWSGEEKEERERGGRGCSGKWNRQQERYYNRLRSKTYKHSITLISPFY